MELYNSLKLHEPIPKKYPHSLSTLFNSNYPLVIQNPLDGVSYNVSKIQSNSIKFEKFLINIFLKIFLGASPQQLCANGRSEDLEAILQIIETSTKVYHKSKYIAV